MFEIRLYSGITFLGLLSRPSNRQLASCYEIAAADDYARIVRTPTSNLAFTIARRLRIAPGVYFAVVDCLTGQQVASDDI